MPFISTGSLDIVSSYNHSKKMNQLCKVCGEPAAGFHFGAFTCEGCKSFFGRTYNNISAISGCKNNGDCVINKKNRTACKACRLRKCLLVGMSKSGSRYGRRSNWFKIHCLLQEQQSQQQLVNQQQALPSNFEQFSHIHQQFQSQHTYQEKAEQSNKTASLQSPKLTPSPFLGIPLLNGNNGQLKTDPRVSSPSDSGASSADPEDTSSNKDSVLDSTAEEKLRKVASLENIRSLSEPLKGFQTLSPKLSPFSPVPLMNIPPIVPGNFSGSISVQEEPIDLSVKSRKRCRTTSPTQTGIDLPKPTPLDLTLVRSQPMSG